MIYEGQANLGFVLTGRGFMSAPDVTTRLKFNDLVDRERLPGSTSRTAIAHFKAKRRRVRNRMTMGATIIEAPTTLRNENEGGQRKVHEAENGAK